MTTPNAIAWFVPFSFFYTRKRATAMANKWPKDYKVLTVRNVALTTLMMFGPLLVIVALLK